jgi:transposase-like protein
MGRQYTGEQRSELVELVTAGQSTLPDAASRLEVPYSTASYWVRKAAKPVGARKVTRKPRSAKARSATAPTFLQLVRAGDIAATLEVRIGGAEIRVRRGFDGPLLRAVVEALRGGVE